jgi:hypothetical protein
MLKNKYVSQFDATLRFGHCGRQTIGSTYRLTGLVKLKQIVRLIEVLDLEANPRESRIGKITSDIIESLETTPNLFWVKSKGILLAATVYKELDGDRFEVSFEDPDLEGVLDGGHNLLAIGTYFLGKVLDNEGNEADIKELRKAKVWGEFKAIFQKHLGSVATYLENEENEEELSTLIPVEMLLPKSSDPLDLDNFNDALLEIQIARNNNAQLKQETKSNQEGLYEPLKNSIPKKISDRIEWKSNQEGGEIKAADVVALAWIPLSALDVEVTDPLGKIAPPSPTATYSSKGDCVNRYHRYMSSPIVTTDTVPREMKSNAVISALKLAGDLPELFDLIYELFPAMYNNKDGKFGAIAAVKKLNTKKGKKFTKYMEKSVEYRYPEGFINPLVYGLKSLMKLDAKGEISWVTDPVKFVREHLPTITEGYMGVIKENNMDPQKVGKSPLAYDHALNAFELAWLRSSK